MRKTERSAIFKFSITKIKPTSVFQQFYGMKNILRVRLKPEYCKYNDLDEYSNVFGI